MRWLANSASLSRYGPASQSEYPVPLVVLSAMRRITGAAALAYVVLAAIENMELLGLPAARARRRARSAPPTPTPRSAS